MVTVVTAAVATGIGFVVDATSSARYWFGGPASGVSGSVFYTNQTIQAVLARAEVPALAAKAVWFVATVALLVLIVPVVRRAEPALALLVTVAGFALLASPTSWSHHWCGSRRPCSWSSWRGSDDARAAGRSPPRCWP